MRRYGFRNIARPLPALALAVFLSAQAEADTTVTTTRIAEPDGSPRESFQVPEKPGVKLEFKGMLPATNAKLGPATLRIVRATGPGSKTGKPFQVRLEVVATEDSAKSFGANTLEVGKPKADEPATFTTSGAPAWIPSDDGAAIRLTLVRAPDYRGRQRWWHGTGAESANHRPRLIMRYLIPGGTVEPSAGQPRPYSPRAFEPDPMPAGLALARMADGLRSHTPAFRGDLAYVLTDGKELKAVSAPFGREVWKKSLSGTVGQDLHLSPQGRLIILGDGSIRVFELNDDPIKAPEEVHLGDGRPIEPGRDLVPRQLSPHEVAPAIGPDGSIFVKTVDAIVGISPDLRLLWSVDLQSEAAGRPTVGPGGEFVYVVTGGRGLLAIDAATGELLSEKLPEMTTAPTTLRAPVVTELPNGTELVWVSAHAENGGTLSLFENIRTERGPERDWKLRPVGELKGVWGLPLPDRQLAPKEDLVRVYALLRDTTDGTAQIKAVEYKARPKTLEARDVGDLFASGDGEFIASARLVADAEANVYGLSTDSGGREDAFTSTVVVVQPGSDGGAVEGRYPLPPLPTVPRLMFGDNGTLYAIDDVGHRLMAVVPSFAFDTASAKRKVSSPTHAELTGAVPSGTQIVASGGISLAPGASLAPGVSLSVGQQ